MAHTVCQGPQANHLLLLVLLSLLSVGWSEPVNVYFLSHDIHVWHILYLAILYSDTTFKLSQV